MKKKMITTDYADEIEELVRRKRIAFARGLISGFSAPMNLFGDRNLQRIEYDFDSVAHAWRSVELSLNHALLEYECEVQSIEEKETAKEERPENTADPKEDNTAAA